MKKLVAYILLFSFTLSACSHVLPKYQNESKSEFYARINKLTKDRIVSLKIVSEQTYDCKILQVNSDSTSIYDINSNSFRTVMTNNIISVSYNDSERGAWDGLIYGFLIGGIVGLLPNLFLSKGAGHPSGNPFLILYGALAGIVIGVTYGSYNDSKTTILIND